MANHCPPLSWFPSSHNKRAHHEHRWPGGAPAPSKRLARPGPSVGQAAGAALKLDRHHPRPLVATSVSACRQRSTRRLLEAPPDRAGNVTIFPVKTADKGRDAARRAWAPLSHIDWKGPQGRGRHRTNFGRVTARSQPKRPGGSPGKTSRFLPEVLARAPESRRRSSRPSMTGVTRVARPLRPRRRLTCVARGPPVAASHQGPPQHHRGGPQQGPR